MFLYYNKKFIFCNDIKKFAFFLVLKNNFFNAIKAELVNRLNFYFSNNSRISLKNNNKIEITTNIDNKDFDLLEFHINENLKNILGSNWLKLSVIGGN